MPEGGKEGGKREIRGEDGCRPQTKRLGWEAGGSGAAADSERAGRGTRSGRRAVAAKEVRCIGRNWSAVVHGGINSRCPYPLSSETTAKGTGLEKLAGKEDPVELDSSLAM
ncbi:hypothetical protein Trydic_g10119 [Trypoxylus dichotomus]